MKDRTGGQMKARAGARAGGPAWLPRGRRRRRAINRGIWRPVWRGPVGRSRCSLSCDWAPGRACGPGSRSARVHGDSECQAATLPSSAAFFLSETCQRWEAVSPAPRLRAGGSGRSLSDTRGPGRGAGGGRERGEAGRGAPFVGVGCGGTKLGPAGRGERPVQPTFESFAWGACSLEGSVLIRTRRSLAPAFSDATGEALGRQGAQSPHRLSCWLQGGGWHRPLSVGGAPGS